MLVYPYAKFFSVYKFSLPIKLYIPTTAIFPVPPVKVGEFV